MRFRALVVAFASFLAFSGAVAQTQKAFGVTGALGFFPAVLGVPTVLETSSSRSLTLEKPGALTLLFGPLTPGYAGQSISLRLMTWSLPWIGFGIVGLWASNESYWKGFWGMNAAWGLINTGIAYAGLLGSEPDPAGLRTTLLINAGADLLYVAGGLYLLSRPEDTWRGSGAAVIVQGAFLLVFDLLHAFLVQGG